MAEHGICPYIYNVRLFLIEYLLSEAEGLQQPDASGGAWTSGT